MLAPQPAPHRGLVQRVHSRGPDQGQPLLQRPAGPRGQRLADRAQHLVRCLRHARQPSPAPLRGSAGSVSIPAGPFVVQNDNTTGGRPIMNPSYGYHAVPGPAVHPSRRDPRRRRPARTPGGGGDSRRPSADGRGPRGRRPRSAAHVDGVHPRGFDRHDHAPVAWMVVIAQVRLVFRAEPVREGVVVVQGDLRVASDLQVAVGTARSSSSRLTPGCASRFFVFCRAVFSETLTVSPSARNQTSVSLRTAVRADRAERGELAVQQVPVRRWYRDHEAPFSGFAGHALSIN